MGEGPLVRWTSLSQKCKLQFLLFSCPDPLIDMQLQSGSLAQLKTRFALLSTIFYHYAYTGFQHSYICIRELTFLPDLGPWSWTPGNHDSTRSIGQFRHSPLLRVLSSSFPLSSLHIVLLPVPYTVPVIGINFVRLSAEFSFLSTVRPESACMLLLHFTSYICQWHWPDTWVGHAGCAEFSFLQSFPPFSSGEAAAAAAGASSVKRECVPMQSTRE